MAGVLETMADAHFVRDADFRFVSVNAATERTLVQRRDQLLGRSIWEKFPSAVGGIFEESYRRVATHAVSARYRAPARRDWTSNGSAARISI
ncbi:hypothetical protein BH11GEM2_BH11GEM2_24700 [soil metagenome]